MMDNKKEFEKIMAETTEMALATSVENKPNVRILNFIYSKEEKILYFQSKKEDQKEKEFEKNNIVAFTTIPKNGLSYVRVSDIIVKKSEKTIYDVKDTFSEKMPFYKDFIKKNGNTMDLYEIHLSKILFFPNPDEFEVMEL
jgi:uncharacterized pyridoxamine 5'-phosphate oxidase family protein